MVVRLLEEIDVKQPLTIYPVYSGAGGFPVGLCKLQTQVVLLSRRLAVYSVAKHAGSAFADSPEELSPKNRARCHPPC